MKRGMLLAVIFGWLSGSSVLSGELEKEFACPPDSARMWTWWFWLGDKVDKTSITADLEALKAQGIAGVTVYSLSGPGVPGKGPNYMSAEWRDLWKHTLKEAERLGLGVSTMLCSGWNAGGPWIKPEQACKRHVHSELILEGPQHFKGKLPLPVSDQRFYRDSAVQALPVAPADGKSVMTLSASSSHNNYPVGNAGDGDGDTFWVSNGEKPNEGPSKDKPEWLRVDLGQSRAVKKVTVQPRPGYGPRDAEVQISKDGTTFTAVKALVMEREKAAEIQLPDKPVRYIRLFVSSTYSPQSENVQVCEVFVDGQPLKQSGPSPLLALKALSNTVGGMSPTKEINGAVLQPLPSEETGTAISPASVVDLTARCTADGELEWDVPAGTWKILRTGFTLTGAMTSWSSPTGIGFESDPLDAAAMEFQFANTAALLAEDAGALAGKVFRSVQIDSWEINHPNWSAGLIEGFVKFRGYDPRPYLPALSGLVVGNSETSDRFLYDYRKTVGDLVAENYFGRLSTLAASKGIVQQSEAGGVCSPKAMALDCLKNLGRCAIPMGEFWQDGTWVEANQNKNGKQTASAAHLYGKRISAAEAFTSFIHWVDSPASLKPTADRAFCEGFNHFFIFSSATRSEDGLPGTEFCAGTHFNRKITWWNQSRGFNDYIARCSHLLQQGLFVGDVLFYNGDQCPNFVGPKHIDPSVGPGYDYDVCNTEIMLTRLAIKEGRIVLPDGMSYRVLALPEYTSMPVEVLSKLKELVSAGMTVVGPKPVKSPGLKDYPKCDEQVKAMADELWGECDGKTVTERAFGKGRVVWGRTVRDVLGAAGVQPDFTYSDAQSGAFLDWIHRSADGAQIYFIANRNNRAEKAICSFRVRGKQPEIWDPVTGTQRAALTFSQGDDGTRVALEFPAYGSLFVIFRNTTRASSVEGRASDKKNFPDLKFVQELTGPWTVQFGPKGGGPEEPVIFGDLTDWANHSDPKIKYYSGKATYRKTFDSAEPRTLNPLFLDLGELNSVAEVRLNGMPLGILWTRPYRLDVSAAMKKGSNELEIDIVNLWPNRLIGDGKLPSEKRITQTNIGAYYSGEHKLLPSGLLGPVRVLAE
ncbi:MAG: glycosyl hydrolase [bacterium]